MERKKPMGKRVTLADIAKVAGVTPATVQRALKGLEGVGDEQRQNILRVAKEMNYRPNVLASTLKKGEVNIAIVLPDAEDENQYYAASLWDGVQAVLDLSLIHICSEPGTQSSQVCAPISRSTAFMRIRPAPCGTG